MWACLDRRFAKLEQPASSSEGVRTAHICVAHPFVSECEALAALELCDYDETRAVRKLRNYGFLMRVRKVKFYVNPELHACGNSKIRVDSA